MQAGHDVRVVASATSPDAEMMDADADADAELLLGQSDCKGDVKDALYHAVLLTGGQAVREVTGLQRKSKLRPDLQIVYPGRHVLTDVAVVHPLGVHGCERPENSTATAKKMASAKRTKYAAVASRHDAELIPFVVETCGGLSKDAIALLDVISGAASEHLSLWSQEDAAKEVLNSVAIAVQKGNAMTVLGCYAAALLRAA